jgi:hypothetical protein
MRYYEFHLSPLSTCAAYRNARVIHDYNEVKGPSDEDYDLTWGGRSYRILKCAGCETVYFKFRRLLIESIYDESNAEGYDNDMTFEQLEEWKESIEREVSGVEGHILADEHTYWPVPKRQRPDWRKLDATLIKLLDSVYTALENDLLVLAAIGMRVVFDRASELIGIDPDKSFAKKLEQLHQEGHIGAADKEYLQILTDAGSAAAHRGWEPDVEQLRVLTSIMEHFVRRFILKDEAGRLREAIPPRHKRRTFEVVQSEKSVIEFPASKTTSKDDPLVPDHESS